MKRATAIITVFMLAAIALAVPAGAQEAPVGPNVSMDIQGWNLMPTGRQEQMTNWLLQEGLFDEDSIPLPTDENLILDLGLGDFWFRLITGNEEEAYRRGYADA